VPQIIVTANGGNEQADGRVLMRERVKIADLESDHFGAQLVERVGWALSDADEVEQDDVRPTDV
jgi:hypothetical protein